MHLLCAYCGSEFSANESQAKRARAMSGATHDFVCSAACHSSMVRHNLVGNRFGRLLAGCGKSRSVAFRAQFVALCVFVTH